MAESPSEPATDAESQASPAAEAPSLGQAPPRSQPSPTPPTPTDTKGISPAHNGRDEPNHKPGDDEPGEPFGASLEPVLRRACDDRLSAIRWFRTDWQRGGALTGYASYRADDGADHHVVVKMPVPPRERYWLARVQREPEVAPVVYAHGDQVGGYDLAWVVMEALPHGPLNPQWQGAEFDLLIDAASRFYAATRAVQPPDAADGLDRDWHKLLELAVQQVRNGAVSHPREWKEALKKAGRRLDGWLERWRARPIADWCHGDLHLANAMTRHPPPDGPALLLDLAQVRPGHWVEDAVYFEHLYWAWPERLAGRKLCKQLARARKGRGIRGDDGWAEFAQLKRALLAMAAPARLNVEGSERHVQAALAVLQRHVR